MSTIKNETIQNTFTGILVLCAVFVCGLLGYQFFASKTVQVTVAPTAKVADWKTLISSRKPIIGNAGASFNIIEFSDYQCPFCRSMESGLIKFASEHPRQVALYRYEYPLTTIHPLAYSAALAAKCGAKQGILEQLDRVLFQTDLKRAESDWTAIADESGVPDVASFVDCVAQRQTDEALKRDIAVASKIGVQGTPTLIINGDLYPGLQTEKSLNRLLKKHGSG